MNQDRAQNFNMFQRDPPMQHRDSSDKYRRDDYAGSYNQKFDREQRYDSRSNRGYDNSSGYKNIGGGYAGKRYVYF